MTPSDTRATDTTAQQHVDVLIVGAGLSGIGAACHLGREAFLYLCSGYYRYDEGYTPTWPGRDDFTGAIVHPQHWPADLDITGKRIVVIGSGASAVTLVPALARTAGHVTMLQRSPSFVMALPAHDPVADVLRKVLPERRAYAAVRWKNVRIATAIYRMCRKHPARARALLRSGVRKRLPAGYDVVTDHVDAFTPTGLRLRSGATIDADIIVTATGLNLLPLGGIELTVDGATVRVPERVAYKGMMLDGVPNLAFALGYTNASWTLKVDLVSAYVSRLLSAMKREGLAIVTPRLPAAPMKTSSFIDMTSGYFERSRDTLPLQGDRAPWRLRQHYAKDAALLRGGIDDEELELRPAAAGPAPTT